MKNAKTNKYMVLYGAYVVIKLLLFILFISAPSLMAEGQTPGKLNLLIYMGANNNLHRLAQQDIREMTDVGSNENCKIFVQIDNFGKNEVGRYLVERRKLKKSQPLPRRQRASAEHQSLFTNS